MLVTTGMSKPSTRSKTTTGLRPARSSSKTVAVMSSSRLTGWLMRTSSSG
jgi:hypothetical protein